MHLDKGAEFRLELSCDSHAPKYLFGIIKSWCISRIYKCFQDIYNSKLLYEISIVSWSMPMYLKVIDGDEWLSIFCNNAISLNCL